MRLVHGLFLMTLCAAGCAQPLHVDTSTLPPGTYADSAVDDDALYEANHAFGIGGHLPTKPQEAAHAFAALDYAAGIVTIDQPYVQINGAALAQMQLARQEGRAALGIQQGTPSQLVVNALLAVSHAPDSDLKSVLSNPIFTLGPDATLARLTHPPEMFQAAYAIPAVYRGVNELSRSCNNIFC